MFPFITCECIDLRAVLLFIAVRHVGWACKLLEKRVQT
jgi:hypothetical protein